MDYRTPFQWTIFTEIDSKVRSSLAKEIGSRLFRLVGTSADSRTSCHSKTEIFTQPGAYKLGTALKICLYKITAPISPEGAL